MKKECIAMLLAGGQGSRLFSLTEKSAKPAVNFGTKYRLIDFPLSNCVNSGIDTVGVLTQYQPLVLNEYIGTGQPWDLDRQNGGVMVLPPYQAQDSADWYKGTANAVHQHFNFINRYNPDHVLVLGGDHIYKMDYDEMLHFHKASNAGVTIAVLDVPLEEASRFGVVHADSCLRISHFEEKPEKPQSTLVSMGIYLFDKQLLEKYLAADAVNADSTHDFGNDVLPAMLDDDVAMYAYKHEGYWKDVGTLESLWEANMDLLGENPKFNIFDTGWRIYSRSGARPPQYIGKDAQIENSFISDGCIIHGTVINSVISCGVTVAAGAVVRDSVVMTDSHIAENASVNYAILGEGMQVETGAVVGTSENITLV